MFCAVYSRTTNAIPCPHTAQPHPKSTNSPAPQDHNQASGSAAAAVARPFGLRPWRQLLPLLTAAALACLAMAPENPPITVALDTTLL